MTLRHLRRINGMFGAKTLSRFHDYRLCVDVGVCGLSPPKAKIPKLFGTTSNHKIWWFFDDKTLL